VPFPVPPDHGSVAGVLERIAPDLAVELRDANTNQPIAAIAVGDASVKTRFRESMSRSVARSGPRTLRSGRHITVSQGLVPNGGDSARQIVPHSHHTIEALAHRIDMRDQDDLGEAVRQAAQQIDNGSATVLIQ
jgi:hypothetical protein